MPNQIEKCIEIVEKIKWNGFISTNINDYTKIGEYESVVWNDAINTIITKLNNLK